MDAENRTHICSICQQYYGGFGNNAWPINNGRCCNDCNSLVISARLEKLFRKMQPKGKDKDEGHPH